MPNPFLPPWEYIPDGEPRVFGDRIYIYGSHDKAGSDKFCDYRLKVWSASINNLDNWVCHGDIFRTKETDGTISDSRVSPNELYAPDVVKKGDKYYLYAYIANSKGIVAVSDTPEAPFTFLSEYKYTTPQNNPNIYENGMFIDPAVLVDDDGKVYIYCGYKRSYMAQINPDNMYEVIDGTYKADIIPTSSPFNFFEACSIRKINGLYYLIYSPATRPSQLVYATSHSPTGPFEYRGVIIDSGLYYPAGNNHGSIINIRGQWYVFYHRMTNGTIMSRRACVEKIELKADGTIKMVEPTSLGFESVLSPYCITSADTACVLTGGAKVIEKNIFSRTICNITNDTIIGYKYFDFGLDNANSILKFNAKVIGAGANSVIDIYIDKPFTKKIGSCNIGTDSGVYSTRLNSISGTHAIFLVIKDLAGGDFKEMFDSRSLFELEAIMFSK